MATRRRRHTSAGGFCTGAFIREYDGKSSNRDSRWQRIARRLRSPRERTGGPREFAETEGDELELIFDGAGTQWIPERKTTESDYHELYQAVRDDAAVCDYCSGAFGVEDAVADSGLVTLDEYDGHPSVRSLVDDDYEIITF